jgi:tight adherence protein C
MGRSTGEALRNLAMRFDLEELRSLAAVISQAERFGTSVVKALSVYAETMRLRRHQRAEELAHQASIKMLAPTFFCMFPAIFIVIVGPAAIRIYETFIGPSGVFNR